MRRSTRTLVLSSLPGLLVGTLFGFGKIIRDCSLTCNVGFRWAPVAILAVTAVVLPLAALRVRIEERVGWLRWQIGSAVAIALSFVVFRVVAWWAVERDGSEAARWTYLGFFVWLGATGALLGPNVKSGVYRLHSEAGAGTGLAVSATAVTAGGMVGAALASWSTPWLTDSVGLRFEHARDTMMLAMAVVALLGVPVALWIRRATGSSADDAADPEGRRPRVDLRVGLRWIAADALLSRLGWLMLITGVAETVAIYLFYWLVTEQTSPAGGRTTLFAHFYLLLNAGTFLFLLVGTRRLIDRLGVLFAVLSLPGALALGATWLLVQTVVIVVYVMRIAESALEEALYEQGVDRALAAIPSSRAPVVRPMLQGLVPMVGRGVGALVVLALASGLGLPIVAVIVLYLVVVAGWIAVGVTLRRRLRVADVRAGTGR